MMKPIKSKMLALCWTPASAEHPRGKAHVATYGHELESLTNIKDPSRFTRWVPLMDKDTPNSIYGRQAMALAQAMTAIVRDGVCAMLVHAAMTRCEEYVMSCSRDTLFINEIMEKYYD